METEKSLVKASEVKLPKFVQDAYDSIEGMKAFANMLLESKLVPDSYYEKLPDNKPDYTKGKTSAVVVVLLQAQQLGVPPMTALQHIVPVNGLLSIKGDLAKTMIFASGKLRKDSWKETVTGSIENEDMVVTITATRDDNGLTLTRTFSVDKAKRMGLWITLAQVNGIDGWKWKKSSWYKTPDRMVMYRCIGFIARDLFSDVLLNMYTTEEAVDIIQDTTEVIETESGAKITIPDKEHAKQRSGKMTDRVADKIPDNKFGAVSATIPDAVVIEPEKKESAPDENESPFKADKGSVEYLDGKPVIRDEHPGNESKDEEGKYTLKQLENTDTKVLLEIINADTDMIEAMELVPGKNTNKKLREIIFAHQEGKLAEHVAPYMKEAPTEENAGEGIKPNTSFDKDKSEKEIDNFLTGPSKKVEAGNKYSIDVPTFDKGDSREFSTVKTLFNKMMGVTPQITIPRYMDLAERLGLLQKYPNKEKFIKEATVEEINSLLNAN